MISHGTESARKLVVMGVRIHIDIVPIAVSLGCRQNEAVHHTLVDPAFVHDGVTLVFDIERIVAAARSAPPDG